MPRPTATAPFLALVLLAAGGLASATVAKDAGPRTADSPIVGAWLLDVGNDPTIPPTQAVFHADGTYLQTDGGGVGIGSWEATGPTTGVLTFSVYDVEQSGGFSSATVRATVETSADGESLTGVFTLEQVNDDGTSTGQMGPGEATGTRVAIEEMSATPTPMGPAPSPATDATSQTLNVTLDDFTVATSSTTVKAGQPITFAVINRGAQTHEMVLEKAGDDDVPLSAGGLESEIEDMAPGSTAEMTWTITEPGMYQLACHVPGHFEQGMVTTFEVVES